MRTKALFIRISACGAMVLRLRRAQEVTLSGLSNTSSIGSGMDRLENT